jgi:hypothetical protein
MNQGRQAGDRTLAHTSTDDDFIVWGRGNVGGAHDTGLTTNSLPVLHVLTPLGRVATRSSSGGLTKSGSTPD